MLYDDPRTRTADSKDVSVACYEQAIKVLERVAADHPDVPVFRHELAEAGCGLAYFLDSEAAIPVLLEAIQQRRTAMLLSPDNATFRQGQRNNLLCAATTLAQTGRCEEASALLDEFLAAANRQVDFVVGAVVYFSCSRLALEDAALPEEMRTRRSQKYLAAARKHIADGVRSGQIGHVNWSDPLYAEVVAVSGYREFFDEILTQNTPQEADDPNPR